MSVTTSAHRILKRSPGGSSEDALPAELWELIEQFRGELVNQGYAILSNLEDAEDVAQETFCEAFRNQQKLAEVRSLSAWLRSINRANALNRLRDRKKVSQKANQKQQDMPGRQFTTGGFSGMEIRESVAKAIDKLSDDLRGVVVLHYWEHLSSEQIAERMGISTRTVWRLLHDADLQLFDKLNRYLGQEEQRDIKTEDQA